MAALGVTEGCHFDQNFQKSIFEKFSSRRGKPHIPDPALMLITRKI